MNNHRGEPSISKKGGENQESTRNWPEIIIFVHDGKFPLFRYLLLSHYFREAFYQNTTILSK